MSYLDHDVHCEYIHCTSKKMTPKEVAEGVHVKGVLVYHRSCYQLHMRTCQICNKIVSDDHYPLIESYPNGKVYHSDCWDKKMLMQNKCIVGGKLPDLNNEMYGEA